MNLRLGIAASGPACSPVSRVIAKRSGVARLKSDSKSRVVISCPGCGRHDTVKWPAGQQAFHWKCFNCHKEFDLRRKDVH